MTLSIEMLIPIPLSPVSRARKIIRTLSWGSAALHPRLYAAARSASLGRKESAMNLIRGS
jgi:hypothetical protein